MLKRLTCIVLIFSILATLARCTIPYLWYYANYEYIAHELCENRHHPEMECNGMCQVKKMMHKQHDHENRQPALQVTQEQKINLFFTGYIAPVTPAPASIPFFSETMYGESLWFDEPVLPPPQYV